MDNIKETMNMNLEELRNAVEDKEGWHIRIHNVAQSWRRLNEREMKTPIFTFNHEIKCLVYLFTAETKVDMALYLF